MKHRPLVLAAILSLAASTQLSQQNAPQTNAGTIRGVVTREGTSEPIADVLISLVASGARGGGARGFDGLATAEASRTTRTDRTGRFTLADIAEGVYTIRAELEGYFAPQTAAGFASFVSRTLMVTRSAEDATFSLVPGAVISGRALDVGGRPALGSTVQALRLVYRNGRPNFQVQTNSAVDDRGEYRLFQLPPGEYYLCAFPAQGGRGRGFANRGGRGGVGEASLAIYYPDTIDPLRSLPIELRAGEERTGINFNLRTPTMVRISGQVVSNVAIPGRVNPRGGDTILPAAQLSLVPRDLNIPVNPAVRSSSPAQLNEPDRGRFELIGAVPGKYDLFATVLNANAAAGTTTASTDEPRYFAGRVPVDVGLDDLQNVSIVIGQSIALKVHLTVDGTASVPADTVRLQLQSADTAVSITAYSPTVSAAQTIVNTQGEVTIPFVNEGLYRLQVQFRPFLAARGERGTPARIDFLNAYVDDIRQGGLSVHDSGLSVGTRDLGPVEVLVKTNGGTIDGVVSDARGNPQAGVTVVLAPPENRRQNPDLYKMVTTSPAGRFNMRGIPPGSHKLFAWPSIPTGAYQNPEFISKDEQRGRQILVNASSTTNADLTLITATRR
jgi:hypothetical protein